MWNRKATGDDDVPGEVLKLLGEGSLKILTELNTIYETIHLASVESGRAQHRLLRSSVINTQTARDRKAQAGSERSVL
jgi:hypothetical protein